MANPRQRRKTRSGTHRPVQHSRRAKKQQKKQPPIRGPQVVQEAWDGRKTVRQNYEALGLMASLNPIASGGTERVYKTEAVGEGEKEKGVGKGFGRIIRDEEGNVVDVEMPVDEEDDEEEEKRSTGWVEKGSGEKTKVVEALEALRPSSGGTRFSSSGERAMLVGLVAKYGDDVEGMARDVKMNVWQRTAGELRRALWKAGIDRVAVRTQGRSV